VKKRILIALVVVLALAATASMVWAKGGGPTGPSGKSNVGHLYLREKDPATWEIVEHGAWGKMKYKLSGPAFDFVFNGHELNPGGDYTLIYYPDYDGGNPWPRVDIRCLAHGAANEEGNIHLAEAVELNSNLPMSYDYNTGAKIWLVESSAVECEPTNTMSGWNPTEYLFEYDLINYEDTDL